MTTKIRIGYVTGTSGNWGGAGRVIFSIIKNINKELFDPLVVLPSDGSITRDLERDGVRYRIFRKKHGSIVAHLLDIIKLTKLFRKEKLQLIHLNFYDWRTPEIIAAKILGIPVLVHYHTAEQENKPYLNLVDRIITVSDFCKIISKPENVKKTTIYNTVDLDKFRDASDIRNQLSVNADDIIVTFIGQIKKIKGIETFLDLAESVQQKNIKFLIAGQIREPEFEQTFLERVEKLANTSHLGYIEKIEDIFKTSDIIVVPSLWEEPFGLINIEAGAAAKPVIATRTGGIPEIINDGVNGFLYDKNDKSTLLKTTIMLANDREKRVVVGENALAHVKQHFTTEPIIKLEKEYLDLTS